MGKVNRSYKLTSYRGRTGGCSDHITLAVICHNGLSAAGDGDSSGGFSDGISTNKGQSIFCGTGPRVGLCCNILPPASESVPTPVQRVS
jgi:hypothetical protein